MQDLYWWGGWLNWGQMFYNSGQETEDMKLVKIGKLLDWWLINKNDYNILFIQPLNSIPKCNF